DYNMSKSSACAVLSSPQNAKSLWDQGKQTCLISYHLQVPLAAQQILLKGLYLDHNVNYL
ncbi:hypothetical protein NDU88_004306, partial [Pleurodeles waltl]